MHDFPMKVENIIASGNVEGIVWVAYPAPMYGAVNGYVRLPDGHPWLDKEKFPNGYDIPTEVPWGEITYNYKNWIGFDSLHSGQYWPGQQFGSLSDYAIAMTPELVIEWAEQLASEAHEALTEEP